jgi:hypothetical protein
MYKPDPRLPQDQQIIPTHAKKQQLQQQTQTDEYDLTPGDRDLYDQYPTRGVPENEPTSIRQRSPSPPAPPAPPAAPSSRDIGKTAEPNSWPLKPLSKERSGSINGGGYSTMPKVVSPQSSPLNTPNNPSAGQTWSNDEPLATQASPPEQLDKQGKNKRGCGCCVVM